MDSVQNQPSTPGPGTRSGAIEEVPGNEGVSLADLEPLTTLLVHTANSRYRIIVLDGMSILMQGGRKFPQMTAGDLTGSCTGENPLRFGWIGVGSRLEIWSGGRRIVTSPVRAITTERHHSADRPQ